MLYLSYWFGPSWLFCSCCPSAAARIIIRIKKPTKIRVIPTKVVWLNIMHFISANLQWILLFTQLIHYRNNVYLLTISLSGFIMVLTNMPKNSWTEVIMLWYPSISRMCIIFWADYSVTIWYKTLQQQINDWNWNTVASLYRPSIRPSHIPLQ